MPLEVIGITVLWTFLYGYLIIASIDFGAGFYALYSHWTGEEKRINPIIQRYLSPVWEVTNVFLIFFMVGLIGFFPDTAYYYGTALLIPGSIALLLLTIRGSFYAFASYGISEHPSYLFLYGLTGLFIPAAFSTVLTLSEGGFIEKNGEHIVFFPERLLSNPYSWSVVLLAIVSVLYISASFLCYYAYKARDLVAMEQLRVYALFWSVPTLLASFFIFYHLYYHNPVHFHAAIGLAWMFVASLIFFLFSLYLFWKRKHLGWAFICVMLQFGFAFYGYGISHMPYLLYPYITIQSALTSSTMGWALVTAFAFGLLLLIPSILLLLWLFLFNAKYVRGEN